MPEYELWQRRVLKARMHEPQIKYNNKEMEERRFKTRGEQSEYYAQLRGWGPLTEEDKAALDDAVRMVTHLD